MTYRNYLINGEENGISADKWKQSFPRSMYAQDLIEAGSILEDAQWPHPPSTPNFKDMLDGRFVNHFYDVQDGGLGLTTAVLQFQGVLQWATVGDGHLPLGCHNMEKEV